MARKITSHKTVQKKSRTHTVTQVGVSTYRVTSGHSGNAYTVRLQDQVRDGAMTYTGATCTCKWSAYRPASDPRSGCSHVMAVFDYVDEQRTVSAWQSTEQAKRQHRPVSYIGDGVILTSRKLA